MTGYIDKAEARHGTCPTGPTKLSPLTSTITARKEVVLIKRQRFISYVALSLLINSCTGQIKDILYFLSKPCVYFRSNRFNKRFLNAKIILLKSEQFSFQVMP